MVDVILLDSDDLADPAAALARAADLLSSAYVVDLAWLRTTPWRERRLEGPLSLAAALAVSGDGTHLAAADLDHRVTLWDVTGSRPTARWTGHGGMVVSLAFVPDGTILAGGALLAAAALVGAILFRYWISPVAEPPREKPRPAGLVDVQPLLTAHRRASQLER